MFSVTARALKRARVDERKREGKREKEEQFLDVVFFSSLSFALSIALTFPFLFFSKRLSPFSLRLSYSLLSFVAAFLSFPSRSLPSSQVNSHGSRGTRPRPRPGRRPAAGDRRAFQRRARRGDAGQGRRHGPARAGEAVVRARGQVRVLEAGRPCRGRRRLGELTETRERKNAPSIFFFLQGERRRFFLSLFFSKKRKRAASLFARPRPLAPPKWHQPRCGKRVREVPLPPRAQTCSNRSIGGGARGDIFGWQRERETLARLLDGRRSKEPGGEKNQRGAEPGLFSLSLSLSLSLSFHSFFWLRKLFSLRGNANMEKLSPLSF